LHASQHAADNEAAAVDGLSASARELKRHLDAIPANKRLTISVQDDASAAIQKVHDNIAALNSRQIDVWTYIHNVILPTIGTHSQNAAGGFITGPGTGTSDSILAALSNGEFVVNANATAAFRPLLESINSGVPAFANGGSITSTVTPMSTYAPTNVYVTVEGSIRSDSDVADMVASKIDSVRRSKGDISIYDSWSGQKALQSAPISAKTLNTPGFM
jgi:hypothetical protein